MTQTDTDADAKRLTTGDFVLAKDPFALFAAWFEEARLSEPEDPNAMALSTVDASGLPDVRMVLLKDADAHGFVFYTNTESRKGEALAANPKAALAFHWKSLRRQVRVRGLVARVSDDEADAYFQSRARMSRIGAWASIQSRPLKDRATFEARIAEITAQYEGIEIPRPPHWTGFRIMPLSIEFWADRPFRLHDRVIFSRNTESEPWVSQRLYP